MLSSLAIRVLNTSQMVEFYTAVFGFQFEQVKTGPFHSYFGQLGTLQIKLVPIRKEEEQSDFPIHQPGFIVEDILVAIKKAQTNGGAQEGEIYTAGDMLHAALRDPDGNTVEIYQQKK